jgi:hypothetical protein
MIVDILLFVGQRVISMRFLYFQGPEATKNLFCVSITHLFYILFVTGSVSTVHTKDISRDTDEYETLVENIGVYKFFQQKGENYLTL